MATFYVKNLGKIRNAKIEVKDFTVFVGENNTNKTWMAYIIFALSSEKINRIFTSYIIRKKRKDAKVRIGLIHLTFELKGLLKHIKNLQEQIIEEKRGENNVYLYASRYLERNRNLYIQILKTIIKEYLKFLENYAHKVIAINPKLIENVKIKLKINEEKILKEIARRLEDVKLSKGDKINYTDVLQVSSLIFKSISGEAFNIPSERKGLILFLNLINLGEKNWDEIEDYLLDMSISQKFDYEKYRNLIKPFESFRYNYPEPLLEFKDFLSKIPNYKEIENSINKELSDLLENFILEGTLAVNADTNTISYLIENGIELSIVNTSSMVKGLSPLDIYIKYKMKEGDLIIIDEPEMNLHPEAQVKLVEFLSILVNKGIKVLITTHSPYIIDHLINIVAGYKSKNKNKDSLFWLPEKIKKRNYETIKPEDIYLDIEKLSVYHFTNEGEVKNILSKKEETIDWDTFDRISRKISSIYWEL